MRSVSVRLEDLKNMVLCLGYVGENEHTRVTFDAMKMYAQYPNASVSLTVQPPEGDAYPAVIERDGDLVIWEVTDSDLISEGSGELQLAFTDGEKVAKTYIGRFRVHRSIMPTGEIPEPLDDFLTRAGAALTAIPETIDEEFEAITADAVTLEPGSSATAEFDPETKVLTIGVPEGEKGDPGQDGADGLDGYTPQRGVDYWTPADQASMLQDIATEKADAIAAIENKGTQQVGLVTDEGTTQKAAVQAKGDEVLESIPSDYSTLSSDVSNLKSDLDARTVSIRKALTLNENDDVYVPATWEQGLISGTTGEDTDDGSLKRCRTVEYFTNDVSIIVDRSVIPYGTYLYYYDADKTFIKREVFNITESVIPDPAYPYYRVAILDFSNFDNYISAEDASNNFIFYKPNATIKTISSDVAEIKENLVELYIGTMINGRLTATTTDTTDYFASYRLSTTEIVAFPSGGNRKIKVHINGNYLVAIRAGAASTNLDLNLYWYTDGDVIEVPDGYNYYGISVCNKAGDTSHTEKTISATESIDLKLYIENADNILYTNDEAQKILTNARLYFNTSNPNSITRYAVIGHTSDCHGDYKRVDNFLKFCDQVGADAACLTGDIVSYQPSQGLDWFADLLGKHKTLPAVCTGNHDVYSNSMDDDDIYDFMFADIAETIGNTTGKTWYYKDIAAKKIRIISVNLYQYGGTNRWYTHFTSDQLSWLITTLGSTPDDYGIIILSHSPQVSLDTAKDTNYPTFFQDTRLYNNTMNAVSDGVPLYDIVDAFISRGTLSKTYTQTGSPSSVSVSADFTNVDSSVEFIAHLTGHFHQDTVCYVPGTTNKQLMLNVTCTIAAFGGSAYPYLADIQDQGRNIADASQDAFNVYVIDRDNKVVKIVRVGQNMTYQMSERKYMAIPYAD